MITFAVLILCGKTPSWKDWLTIKEIIWENKQILDLSIKVGKLFGPNDFLLGYTNYAMGHYEPLWVTMAQNIDTTTHYDPIVKRIQCHDPKSQKHLVWSKNLNMLCPKGTLALVCIRGCWLRIW